jgi:hypothetical protein
VFSRTERRRSSRAQRTAKIRNGTADAAIAACLRGMAKLPRQADRLAQRSVVAAGARDRDKALQIALDVEPLLHEADVLLTAATIIKRRSQGCREWPRSDAAKMPSSIASICLFRIEGFSQ